MKSSFTEENQWGIVENYGLVFWVQGLSQLAADNFILFQNYFHLLRSDWPQFISTFVILYFIDPRSKLVYSWASYEPLEASCDMIIKNLTLIWYLRQGNECKI